MTVLVGQSSNSGINSGHSIATNSRVLWGTFTAVATGSASTINIWMQTAGGAEKYRLGIWNASTFAPISQTSELNPSSGVSFFASGSISASIVSGTSYILGIFASNTTSTNNIFYFTDSGVTGTNLDDSGGPSGYPVQPTLNAAVQGTT